MAEREKTRADIMKFMADHKRKVALDEMMEGLKKWRSYS